MANATSIYVKDYQNGVTYVDWTALSTDAWTAYAGYGFGSANWVTAVKFRVTAPASAISFSFIAWTNQGGFRDLKYKVTEGESNTYINATSSTAGDGTFTAAQGQYERTTLNITKSLKANTDYVLYIWTNKTTSYESYTSLRVWNADTYPLTVTYTPASSYSVSLSVGSNVTATLALNSSPFGRSGNLSNGSTVYAGEVLKLTYSASTGYAMDTQTINSTTVSSPATHTVAGAVNIVLKAKASTSTISASNGTFGVEQAFTITRYNASYTHTCVAYCAGTSQTINLSGATWSGNVGTVRWTPQNSFMNGIPNATSAPCTLTLTTKSGATTLGTNSVTITLSVPAAVKPSPSLAVSDAMGYYSTYGYYVQGHSKASVTVTDGNSYSATTVSRSTTANGTTYSAASFTTGVLNTTGSNTISVNVTDSRGRSGSASTSISVIAYANPSISAFSVHRCNSGGTADDNGDHFKITYTAVVSPVNNRNAKTLKYRYKEVGNSWTGVSWNAIPMNTYTQSGSTSAIDISTGVANGTSYDVELMLQDDFSTTTRATTLSTVNAILDFNEYGDGVGVGKSSSVRKTLDIGNWSAIGRVIGLGIARESIPANADLDSYSEPGVYAITSNATAGTLVNRPTDYAGTLRVWNAIGNATNPGETWYYVIQEYTNMYTDTWRRLGQSGSGTTITWGAWAFYAGQVSVMQTNLGMTAMQTYTPTVSWNDGSSITVSSIFGYYAQVGKMLWISMRWRCTNLGTTGDKYLLISLPIGYTTPSTAIYSTVGNVVPPTGNSNQYLVRPNGASSAYLAVYSGGGADLPRSNMTTGYYSMTAFVPIA